MGQCVSLYWKHGCTQDPKPWVLHFPSYLDILFSRLSIMSMHADKKMMYGHQRQGSDSAAFKELSKRDAQTQLIVELEKLLKTCPEGNREGMERNFLGFRKLFGRFLCYPKSAVQWDKIEKLPDGAVCDYTALPTPTSSLIKNMLDKLNGGLGTSMGCKGPKSVISVRNDLTFLDLTVQQIENLNRTYSANVPLVLMNSFNTDEETQLIIQKYTNFQVQIHTFNQSHYPRFNKESLMPIARSCNTEANMEAWYPPGHGDFYESFCNSGLLDTFINQGREYVFISNIDNLGATVDLNILNLLLNPEDATTKPKEFLMEVTDKTRADVKGGTLIQYQNKLRLLEIAQVPKENVEDFQHEQPVGETLIHQANYREREPRFGGDRQPQNARQRRQRYPIGNGRWCRHEMFRRIYRIECASKSVFTRQENFGFVASHEQFVQPEAWKFGYEFIARILFD